MNIRHFILLLIPLLAIAIFALWPDYIPEAVERTLSVGGRERTYLLLRPAGLGRENKVPLVIVLHGGFGTGLKIEKYFKWDDQAKSKGFVVAYPDGLNRGWNAGGGCCGMSGKNNVDDLGFITRLIEEISAAENIDPKRVYLGGMSNGAAMVYHYACEGTYPVAAFGPVAGSLNHACEKPHAVSLMAFHGLADHNVPFTGGPTDRAFADRVHWLPEQQVLDNFRQASNCGPPSLRKEGLVEFARSSCAGGREVTLITIEGAGHQWPGSKPPGWFARIVFPPDPPSTAIDATSTLWTFFESQRAQP